MRHPWHKANDWCQPQDYHLAPVGHASLTLVQLLQKCSHVDATWCQCRFVYHPDSITCIIWPSRWYFGRL